MKRSLVMSLSVSLLFLFICPSIAHCDPSGAAVGWGKNFWGVCDVPEPNSGFVAISSHMNHVLGLKEDGTIVAWGWNSCGECDVPDPNSDFVAVAGGSCHSLGLKSDGTVVAWGANDHGECDVPEPNSDFVAIGAGENSSIGLKSDGSVVAWGWNYYGQCDVPEPNSGFISIAAGFWHHMALRPGGEIVAWGMNIYGQCDVPEPNAGFTAIAGSEDHSVGLRSDGTAAAWGRNHVGQCDIPSPNEGFVAVSAGGSHGMGLKLDGTVVVWGENDYGQCDVPAPNSGFFAIAAGEGHCIGLRTLATPVESVFYATEASDGQEVLLRWSVSECEGAVGLRVYRAVSAEGGCGCLTSEPLPWQREGSHIDSSVWPGGEFWYELRAVLASGEEVLVCEHRPSIAVPGEVTSCIRSLAPNPTSGVVEIGYSLSRGCRSAGITVHDVAGRIVARLGPVPLIQGHSSQYWDGTSDAGQRLASGVYFVRFEVDGSVTRRRVVLIR